MRSVRSARFSGTLGSALGVYLVASDKKRLETGLARERCERDADRSARFSCVA